MAAPEGLCVRTGGRVVARATLLDAAIQHASSFDGWPCVCGRAIGADDSVPIVPLVNGEPDFKARECYCLG